MKNNLWLELMSASYHKFNILPEQFWRMTLLELRSLAPIAGVNFCHISKQELQELYEKFPDQLN